MQAFPSSGFGGYPSKMVVWLLLLPLFGVFFCFVLVLVLWCCNFCRFFFCKDLAWDGRELAAFKLPLDVMWLLVFFEALSQSLWIGLQCVIMVFSGQTHFLYQCSDTHCLKLFVFCTEHI